MPTPDQILKTLSLITNNAKLMSIIWHILFGVFAISLIIGWRPSKRLTGILLSLPLLSVSIFAWIYGNPFNGITFLVFAILLVYFGIRLPNKKVEIAPFPFTVLGAIMFIFGWIYPHFLQNATLLNYAYAAPVGLVPCPTLSIIIGMTILLNGLESRGLSWTLVGAGLFYGLFGAIRLGVLIDLIMLAGTVGLMALIIGKFRFTKSI
jgi:hypothetical protein